MGNVKVFHTHEKRAMPEFSTAGKQDICDNYDFSHSLRQNISIYQFYSSILMHWNVASFTTSISACKMNFVLRKL